MYDLVWQRMWCARRAGIDLSHAMQEEFCSVLGRAMLAPALAHVRVLLEDLSEAGQKCLGYGNLASCACPLTDNKCMCPGRRWFPVPGARHYTKIRRCRSLKAHWHHQRAATV